jgi:hypothetical protein
VENFADGFPAQMCANMVDMLRWLVQTNLHGRIYWHWS